MIYLYGLCENRPPDGLMADLRGVTGAVSASETAVGWLVHGPSDGEELLPKRRYLLDHTKVLEAIGGYGTVLPMRFGMVADSPDDFANMVLQNRAEIEENFARLAGKIELGLRVEFARDPALAAALNADPELARTHAALSEMKRAPHFEAAEFGRKLAEAMDRRRSTAQKQLLSALQPDLSDYRIRTPESDVQVLAVDVLIPQQSSALIAQRLEIASKEVSGFADGAEPHIRIIGPVPAFSFVDLTLTAAKVA